MRRWHHEVSAEWLQARQSVLTATDVAGLLPEYKRYLKAGSPDKPTPGFAALWCNKNSKRHLDTESVNAAARGHVIEPYAVDDWNMQHNVHFYHWDDAIVVDKTGKLGFSPDAMSIMQVHGSARYQMTDDGERFFDDQAKILDYIPYPAEVMEIKCYEPAQHMKAILKDKMEHDELMQLAMAFVVMPKLEVARLTWYCPGAPIPMFSQHYLRDDLHDQERWIMEIAEVYYDKVDPAMRRAVQQGKWMRTFHDEDEIWGEHMAELQGSDMFVFK